MSYVSSVHGNDWISPRPSWKHGRAGGHKAGGIRNALRPSVLTSRPQPRRLVTADDFPGFPVTRDGRGTPLGFYDWYDWVVVWRHWNRDAEGLRRLYLLEVAELLRLGEGMTGAELAVMMRVSERTVERWQRLLTA